MSRAVMPLELIGHQMTFLDPAFLVFRQTAVPFAKMLTHVAKQRLLAPLWNEYDMVFAVHFVWFRL
jgi:hypothetical protein